MSKQAKKIQHSGRLHCGCGWRGPLTEDKAGKVGDTKGGEHSWLSERQVWRSRDKKLPGAPETTPFHLTGTWMAKVADSDER